jgi:threonine/homoserine/homoserine lactone efflux protein
MQMKNKLYFQPQPASLLRKLVALFVTAMMVGLVLMFSVVLFVIIVVVGTIGGAYLWWKTRELRKQLRSFESRAARQNAEASNDEVFEGEVIRVVEPKDLN